ncbi:hypothetical protein MA16_Dca014403 [Dendrobium catenatum]|uniref:Uncharacterized protein n=1 Tax=Dendrobium catenatum TaxID=906689 RepID=A0A2I0WWK1_9ASPA|nr:hypothetical protein MA16_Dca014403 [Dendrobium catenatum]
MSVNEVHGGSAVVVSGSPVVNVDVNAECLQVETLNGIAVGSNNLVEVPVNLADTNTMVNRLGGNSGYDIRNHVDWLHGSSEFESESDFSGCGVASPDFFGGSDPGNEFTLVRDRPVISLPLVGVFVGGAREEDNLDLYYVLCSSFLFTCC